MQPLHELLKSGRASKHLTVKQVSDALNIDRALISRFENNQRRPTRNQVLALSELFGIDPDVAILSWLTEKILSEIEGEKLGMKALKAADAKLSGNQNSAVDDQFSKLLSEMDALKAMLGKKD